MNAIWMWTEGVDHGLVWDGGAAVLDGEVPLGSAVRLWSALDKGAGLGEFLEELSRELEVTLLSLPAFAIGLRRDDGWQLAARGTLEIVIDGSEVVQGRALSTWTERTVTRVTSLSLGRSVRRHGTRHGVPSWPACWRPQASDGPAGIRLTPPSRWAPPASEQTVSASQQMLGRAQPTTQGRSWRYREVQSR